MSKDHEEWLHKQGVKIVGQNTLRRAVLPSYNFRHQDDPIDWGPIETKTELVYQVEIDEKTVERLQRHEAMISNAMEHAARLNRHGFAGPGSIAQYVMDNSNRHYELLKENSMYKDAWKEFQTIRALLGETPHWP